jgi:hypothetical protein
MARDGDRSAKTEGKEALYKVLGLLRGMSIARAVHVAAKYRIPDLLKDGPKHISELAAASQTDTSALHRLLAALSSIGVFEEIDAGYFANTELSIYLRSDVPESLFDAALYWGSDWQWRTWGALDYTVKTGQRAFDHLFGMSLWDFLAERPEERRVFNSALSSFSASLIPLIVQSYDFSGIQTLVDVGGNEGSFLIAVLSAYPAMRGILCERPALLEDAHRRVAEAGLTDRCELVPGNFLEEVPAGADAYVLREVLHDWNDEHSLQILRTCRRAMRPDSKLLTVEHILYPDDKKTFTRFLGLQMALEQEGHQRSEQEFYALYAASGFALQKMIPIPVPTTTIIEGIPA